MDTPVSSWKLGELVETDINELKFASLTTAGGPIILSLSGIAPFEPSSFQESSVKNLDIRLDASTEEKLECMQSCINEQFSQPRYKGDAFKPFLHKNGEYPANLRVKIQMAGMTKTRFWSKEDKKLIPAPEQFAGALFDAKVLLKKVWYAESAWGISLQATDLMLIAEAPVPDCPF